MKNKGLIITLISILSVLFISLIVLLIVLLKGNFHINLFQKVSKNLVYDETYENTFKRLDINTTASDIYVKNSTDNSVHALVYGDEKYTKVTTDKDILKINIKNKACKGFCINNTISKVVVYLPISYDKPIDINTNYGDIKLEEFALANTTINTNYGDINVDKINKADINTDYGDIKINFVNSSLNIQTNYGDIKVVNCNINKDSSIKTDLGNINIKKINDIYVEAETDLGDVKIKGNNRKADITLKLKTDLGDIKVQQ